MRSSKKPNWAPDCHTVENRSKQRAFQERRNVAAEQMKLLGQNIQAGQQTIAPAFADVIRGYPRLNDWRRVRWQLTNKGLLSTFDNDFSVRAGLSIAPVNRDISYLTPLLLSPLSH
jgi:hypothetical protein